MATGVVSGRVREASPRMAIFESAYRPDRMLPVGESAIAVEESFANPVEQWILGRTRVGPAGYLQYDAADVRWQRVRSSAPHLPGMRAPWMARHAALPFSITILGGPRKP